jgi:hypothetical protein
MKEFDQEYEDNQRQADESLNEDDPFYFDDDQDEDQTPDAWGCSCCGKIYGRRPMGGMCDCAGYVEELYY